MLSLRKAPTSGSFPEQLFPTNPYFPSSASQSSLAFASFRILRLRLSNRDRVGPAPH